MNRIKKLLDITFCRLKESVSAIIYHNTHINKAKSIIIHNKFLLTTSLGTQSDQFSKKFYYISTSRIKFGGFSNSFPENNIVNIVLNGRKFNERYKGGPVDYWGYDFRKQAPDMQSKLRHDENEERVFSDNPEIQDASKYILEIHVSVDETTWFEGLLLLKLCQARKIPCYLYQNNFNSFKILDKRKAITQVGNSRIDALIDIYENYNDLESIPNNYPYDRLKSGLQYYIYSKSFESIYAGELLKGFNTEIHNDRSTEEGRIIIKRLTNFMKKLKVKTIKDLIIKIAEKFSGKT